MFKDLHKVFKSVVNELKNALPNLGESGSEVSHFITEPGEGRELKVWDVLELSQGGNNYFPGLHLISQILVNKTYLFGC